MTATGTGAGVEGRPTTKSPELCSEFKSTEEIVPERSDNLEDNSSVTIRTADERVGYYNLDFLATADEVRDANRAPG